MIDLQAVSALTQLLWMTPQEKVYCILDGASVPDLLDKLHGDLPPEFECLHRGELEPDMAEVVPYLVALEQDSPFTEWVITQGWGNHWGVFVVAKVDLRTLYFHLRTLGIIYDPNGEPMLFRWYDPRVLRVFLPTCDPVQVTEFYGPVERFVAEDDPSTVALTLAHSNGEPKIGKRQIITT